MDRSEINRALAKAIAYRQCLKDAQAEAWARKLIELLECADILRPETRVAGPKEGDRAAMNGMPLVFKGGRWLRAEFA